MRVLSVDLAAVDPRDLGVVVLQGHAGRRPLARPIDVRDLAQRKPLSALSLAQALGLAAAGGDCNAIALDGPQAWKDPANGLIHSRVCDRELNAPAKLGLPGAVLPRTYATFAAFSIRVFDHLAALGWPRLTASGPGAPIRACAMEAFPLAAWRCLGLAPLPAKRKCARDWDAILDRRWPEVAALVDVPFRPSHDQLQAILGGLGPLRLLNGERHGVRLAGLAPSFQDGTWREGFIVCARKSDAAGR